MDYIKTLLVISLITVSGFAVSGENQATTEETQTVIPVQVTKEDVIRMVKAGVSDEVIVNQIKSTNSVIKLSNEDIIELKQAGTSNDLINFIVQIKTYAAIPRGILVSTPTPQVTTSIYYYTYPDPWYDPWYSYWGWGYPYYGGYWYGGGYSHYGHHGRHHGGHGGGHDGRHGGGHGRH